MQVDRGFPRGSPVKKKSTCKAGDAGDSGDQGLIPGLGRSPGGAQGNTPVFLPGGLQSMGVPKSQTGRKQPSTHTCGRHETLAKNINVLFSKGNPSEIAVIQKDK